MTTRSIAPCMPSRGNRGMKTDHGKHLYRQSTKIENMYSRVKDFRTINTRYDRCATPSYPPSASQRPLCSGSNQCVLRLKALPTMWDEDVFQTLDMDWRRQRAIRLHSSLGYQPPAPEVLQWPCATSTNFAAPSASFKPNRQLTYPLNRLMGSGQGQASAALDLTSRKIVDMR
jgi:hypothetical protein